MILSFEVTVYRRLWISVVFIHMKRTSHWRYSGCTVAQRSNTCHRNTYGLVIEAGVIEHNADCSLTRRSVLYTEEQSCTDK